MTKSSHEKALELFQSKAEVTPMELQDHVGIGPYASKIVWDLKRRGHTFTVKKNGRNVVSYSLSTVSPVDKVTEAKAEPPLPKSIAVVNEDGVIAHFYNGNNGFVDREWDSMDDLNVSDLLR